MDDLLTSTYNDGTRVDGVLSPYDGLSRGIITALRNAGYGPTTEGGAQPMPIVTGQDAEIASVKLINDGVQSSTIFKDTRLLAEQAVVAAKAFLEGNEPEANDTETYDNGVKVVPSYLLPVETVFTDDIQPVLIDSDYWTADEVASGQAD
jgi:putative multiple sugar transport system substrate-binding protein